MQLSISRHPITLCRSARNVEGRGHGLLAFHVLTNEPQSYKCWSLMNLQLLGGGEEYFSMEEEISRWAQI